jgi:hypothetical protein
VHDGENISLAEINRREDWTQPMLHKCANPTCTVPFRSLREGKLFLAETFPADMNPSSDSSRRKLRHREHFWLCDSCSAHFTLRFDPALGMLTVPISERTGPRFLTRAAGIAH